MRKVYRFYCEHWKQEIYLCLGSSEAHFVKAVKHFSNIDLPAQDFTNCDGFVEDNDGNGAIFIWIRNKDKSALGPLAHECVHAASFILKSRGVILSHDNDEPLAYLTQLIYEEFLKYLDVK